MYKLVLILSLLSFCLSQSESLKITHLANHGFMFEANGKKVEIDGFFKKFYPQLGVMSDSLLNLAEQAKAPFNDIDVLLSTHEHKDHMGNELIESYLNINTSAQFIGTKQIVDSLHIKNRVYGLTPKPNEFISKDINGIKIDVFNLAHMNKEYANTENIGFVIHIDGKRILHVGDADLTEKNYKSYQFNKMNIDFIIIPFWQVTNQQNIDFVEKFIQPKQIIASHIHPNNLSKVASFLPTLIKDVIIFENELETKLF